MGLKRVYVLACHEPNLDPRVDWVSRFAANRFEVTLFGMAERRRPGPAREYRHGYETRRLAPSLDGLSPFAKAFCKHFWASGLFWWPLVGGMILVIFFLIPMLTLRVLRTICVALLPGAAAASLERRARSLVGVSFFQFFRHWTLLRHFGGPAVTHYREIRKAPRPDLIYCNDLDTLLAGVLLKSVFGCKLIYDAHEFWAHMDQASPWWEVKFFLYYERKLLRHVDAAFTVNHLLAGQMQAALGHHFGALPNCEPLDSAASGLAPAGHSGANARRNTSDQLAAGRVRFLFQGNFAPDRGIHELLRVWARVDSTKAVLFLRGPDNPYKAPCVALAKQLGILDRSAYFLEPVLEHELVAAATEADVGIIPYKAVTINYRYACPNKLSQYMQAGLAILANNLDFVRYAVNRYQCGLIYDVNDPDNFLETINRLIYDAPFRGKCRKQAKEMAVREYNWENMSRELYDTCARLAGLDAPAEIHPVHLARVA
jgi:glycosyltransferase involved in cell wall biosynthesis